MDTELLSRRIAETMAMPDVTDSEKLDFLCVMMLEVLETFRKYEPLLLRAKGAAEAGSFLKARKALRGNGETE
jgi:hypothetical protein